MVIQMNNLINSRTMEVKVNSTMMDNNIKMMEEVVIIENLTNFDIE
jgi:hypothetical protein